ncbi:MBL fold metallo-hydrolase [Aurantimonas marianensis]|uniref:MBL fold metallo-hydrolase n=1 Tax=Aurantimonas marianensis TaxID=2920428 RepID=A0A9X2KFX3_9HYPH|nr:MBL fold metallo-hydrolase [Aurantimonas marianensis]MCP3056259.1 MBL fold metallo-hydrolase [Aurantimonas marianensis]
MAVPLDETIRRVTARNPSPFTFHGTNSYVVGEDRCFVVDPGPDDTAHLDALLAAIDGRPVDAILLTHTHRDHTGLVARLKDVTGAPLLGGGPHRPMRPLLAGEASWIEAAGDASLVFERMLSDDETLVLGGTTLTVIATPGHCANHLAFAVGDDGTVLSGDHVMAWSTTIVAPPDGAMRDYMNSLDRLLNRDDSRYLPGHGGAVERPKAFVRALIGHRRMRENAILTRLRAGDRTIPAIVAAIYRATDPKLHGAAGLSVLAHLEDLAERGLVSADGPPTLGARYEPA